jgi:hypothetical protein
MERSIQMKTYALSVLFIVIVSLAIVEASSISVPLPGAIGSLPKNVSFNAGTNFKHIDEVRLHCIGSTTAGIGCGDGVERPVYPYFDVPGYVGAYMDPPGTGMWIADFGYGDGPFNQEDIFEYILPATWDFLLDGQAELSLRIKTVVIIGGIILVPPSGSISQATLTIKGTVIDISSPALGETLTGGSISTISWQDYRNLSSCAYSYFLDYSIDGGQSWTAINSEAVSGSCSYSWIVPDINSQQCMIRITDAYNSAFTDTTVGYFTINKPPPDLNRDAFVDFLDYAILSANWQQSPDPCDPNSGDIIQNGIVDIYDLFGLCSDWLACYVTQATSPVPVSLAANVSRNVILQWSPGDNAASHDVYFGTDFDAVNNADIDNSIIYMGNQDANFWDTNSYAPGELSPNTNYYWRIDEVAGCTAKGDIWSFTTVTLPPGQASNPAPSDGMTDVSPTTDLSWTAGSNAASHDVYFGTVTPPPFKVNQTGTAYDTGTMDTNTIYYWQINEKNAGGTTTGDVWSFKTIVQLPGQAGNPNPANGAAPVGIATDLHWTAGSLAASHDVYFGTTNPPPFIGNQTGTTYDTETMDINTTYYWQIDEKNNSGTTAGDIWSFTTGEVDTSLVAWWKFDEGTGTIAYDSAGNNHGNLINGPTWTTGQIGGALSFDGVNDYVQVPYSPTLTVTSTFTFAFWIYVDANVDPGGSILSKDGTGDTTGAYNVYAGYGGVRSIGYETNNKSPDLYTGPNSLAPGAWHHVAISFDNSASPKMIIYLDGTEKVSGSPPEPYALSTYFLIGRRGHPTVSYYFNSKLDDIRIYNRALSANEVAILCQQGQ